MLDPPAPSTIVATIPRWLGRRPITGSTVLVGFSDYDDERCVTITLEPECDPTDEVEAVRQAVVDGATDLAIVTYTGSEDARGPSLTAAFVAAAAERYALNVLGVLVVVPTQRSTPGYWRTLPDPTRFPLPTPTEEPS